MTALQVLQKYGWIQGDFGDKSIGFCSKGAIDAAYPHGIKNARAHSKLWKYIKRKYKVTGIVAWNDNKQRTKRQVLAAFKAAKV